MSGVISSININPLDPNNTNELCFKTSNTVQNSPNHHYCDHSNDPRYDENDVPSKKPKLLNTIKSHRGTRGGVAKPFPVKLHEMLLRVEEEGFADVVSWQPHGRSFLVHKPKLFLKQILPRYFNQSKLASFQRQLNLYGFTRLTTGLDRGGYYHELFLQGRLDLCRRMTRQSVKGTGRRQPSSDEQPDFYTMESCVGPLSTFQKEDSQYKHLNYSEVMGSSFAMLSSQSTSECLSLGPRMAPSHSSSDVSLIRSNSFHKEPVNGYIHTLQQDSSSLTPPTSTSRSFNPLPSLCRSHEMSNFLSQPISNRETGVEPCSFYSPTTILNLSLLKALTTKQLLLPNKIVQADDELSIGVVSFVDSDADDLADIDSIFT